MSVSHKSSNTQMFRLMVYRRALHPELFDLQGRRLHRQAEYEVETWVVPAGHLVRFAARGHCVTETVLENADHLPEHGLMHALPCIGEKEFEADPEDPIGYVTTVQIETLTDNLFASTLREMQDFALEVDALKHEWKDDSGHLNLSLLDVQRYKQEFHLQSYHLVGATGLVLRTQSIFEAR